MGIKLSHTAIEMYNDCGEKYRLHYQEKLRSIRIGSALFFGQAIDEAFNRLLLDKKVTELTEKEKILKDYEAKEIFLLKMKQVKTPLGIIDLAKSEYADYYFSDFDYSLLSKKNLKNIEEFAEELEIDLDKNSIEQFIKELKQLKKKKVKFEINEQKLFNYICWLCLVQKGMMLIDGYESQILPQIEKVYSIQEKVELPDEDDLFRGYIDFIASFVDEPNKKYIIDNKTSSRPYKQDSVQESNQLSIYSEYKNIPNCAYIVVEKKIRKRQPKVRINIIKDKIKEKNVDKVFDNITETFYNIKEERFELNYDSCFNYGKPCPYYNYCRGRSLENLKFIRRNNGSKKDKKSINKDES